MLGVLELSTARLNLLLRESFTFLPSVLNPANPFQSASIRLSDPMCVVATNRVRDLTADGQRLTRSDSQRRWLSKLFTFHTCRE